MAKDRRKVKEVLTTNNSLAWGHLNNTHPMPAGSIAFASPQAIGRMAEDRKRSPDKAYRRNRKVANNKKKENPMANPVEKHTTAAWDSRFETKKPVSNVGIPGELEVRNAKEYVDSNEK